MTYMAVPGAAGAISASAVVLANEMLRSMTLVKLKFVALALLLLGSVAAGAGFVAQAKTRHAGKPDLLGSAAKIDDEPKPGRMFVTGRVLDPQRQPVSGASVMVYARPMHSKMNANLDRLHAKEFGRASTDRSGRFRVDIPRISSSQHDEFGAVALAPGYGAGWLGGLDPDADQPTADITLRPERVIHGRLFDVQGQPARHIKVSVTAIRRASFAPGGGRETLEARRSCGPIPSSCPAGPARRSPTTTDDLLCMVLAPRCGFS